MTEFASKRRADDAGVVAPALVVAALPSTFVSVVADALREASVEVAPTSTLDETRQALASNPRAILLLDYPVDPRIAEWVNGSRQQSPHVLPPILLVCASDRLEDAQASPLGDLAIAADAPRSAVLQCVSVLHRLASSEQQIHPSTGTSIALDTPGDSIWPAIVRDLPFAFLVVDDLGRIIEGNPAAADLLATTCDRLIGAELNALLGDSGIETNLLGAPASSWIAGDFVRTRDEEILELEHLARHGVMPGKNVVVLQDATASNRRHALENRAEKMDSLGRLVGGIAHEFNNLLTVILGYCDLSIRLAAADSRFSDALAQIKNSAERGAHLTQLLLAFGRKQVMAPVWIDLNRMLVDLKDHIQKIVGADIELITRLGPTVPQVFVDPLLVQRALVQVVTNARDVLPEKGVLTLATSEFEVAGAFARDKPELGPGRYVCLSIHDNGPGIPSDIKPFIFEPFFTTKSVGKGTGMGLAFVDGVMNQSGGGVDVLSEAGAGTTVRLFFATVNVLPTAPQAPAATAATLLPSHATILLVDDDDGVRKFGSLVLRGQGYQVLEAREGAEALTVVQQSSASIDLVVTDVFMPVMGGVELGNRLATLRPGLPILYQSGRLEDMRQAIGGQERNLHFLTKPFSRDALLVKVSQLLQAAGSPSTAR